MTLSREALGLALQRARAAAGLTQGELGQLTGLGQPLVSRLEAGTRKIDLVELVRVAAALELSVDELLTDAVADAQQDEGDETDHRDVPELVALRLSNADSGGRALEWVPGFLTHLGRLESLHDGDDGGPARR